MASERHAPACDKEREELAAVLSSDAIPAGSNAARLLAYLCRKRLDGEADQIKEYSIAVDVFGRSEDFDKRRDSIVRVEASRLRRKLKEYYDGPGRGHVVQIVLPPGQYVPEFLSLAQSGSPQPNPARAAKVRLRFVLITAAVIVVAVLAAFSLLRPRTAALAPAAARAEAAPPPAVPSGEELRILCGYEKQSYVDRYGRTWHGDRFFNGGSGFDQDRGPIARTLDPNLFHSMRSGTTFKYDIPLRPGTYEMRLHFAETSSTASDTINGGDNSRVIELQINGKARVDLIDVSAQAGGVRTALVRVYRNIQPAADGMLHLAFISINGTALVNAIELLPAPHGRALPVRIGARETAYTDRAGRLWSADSFYSGGRLVRRETLIPNHSDADLYNSERFGRFTYAIPVAPGRYRLTLKFAETYFVSGKWSEPGIRVFNVYCNGATLLKQFDVLREAGGPLRPVEKTFHGIEPDGMGGIFLTFEPVRNYAMVNAIELVEEP